ncbi:MAG: MFS transporter [Turicibacter sp.]|nr:MFS transporter [Turicibacter sp.]
MSNRFKVYKYLVLISSFLIMAVEFSIVNSVSSLFIAPVTKELELSNSAFSFIFTTSALTTAIMSPIIGQLLSRISLKAIMSVGIIFTGGGFFCYSLATQIWMFYLIAIMVGIGTSCSAVIPISTALTYWFEEKKGIALGIVMAGIGTGSFVWMQIVTRMLNALSYHETYAILGLIILAVCLPLTLFIMKLPPNTPITSKKKEKFSYREIHWNRQLILFATGLFLLGISISGTKMHIQPYLTHLGHPLSFNANIGSTQAVFALLGNLIGGYIFDKLNLRNSILIFGTLSLISYICLICGIFPPLLFIFSALFGLCLCLPAMLPSYGTSALFGKDHYAVNLGFINMIFTLGGALGPMISGFIVDNFNYTNAWILYFILTLLYFICLLAALKRQTPQK